MFKFNLSSFQHNYKSPSPNSVARRRYRELFRSKRWKRNVQTCFPKQKEGFHWLPVLKSQLIATDLNTSHSLAKPLNSGHQILSCDLVRRSTTPDALPLSGDFRNIRSCSPFTMIRTNNLVQIFSYTAVETDRLK